MSQKPTSPTWPFLSLLACLFVLSITAPKAWERIARSGSLARRIATVQERFRRDVAAEQSRRAVAKQQPEDTGLTSPAVDERAAKPKLAVGDASPGGEGPSTPTAPLPLTPAPPFAGPTTNDPLIIASRPLPAKAQPQQPDDAPLGSLGSDSPATNPPLVADTGWPRPVSLFDQLQALATQSACAGWANSVNQRLLSLMAAGPSATPPLKKELLDELTALANQGNELAESIEDPAIESQVLRARYAVERRLPLWRRLAAADGGATDVANSDSQLAPNMATAVEQLLRLTATLENGGTWREYLDLDRLQSVARQPDHDAAARRQLARKVLARIERARSLKPQRRFVELSAVTNLRTALRTWEAEPTNVRQMLERLELFERTELASDSQALAHDARWSSCSPLAADRKLAEELCEHYRNANVRVAVLGSAINRMLPQPPATRMSVSETLLGVPVWGNSTTWTQLYVRLLPDGQRVRLGLEANGNVASDTVSDAGQAMFHNAGQSTFLVQKLFLLGPQGLRSWPAIAEARTGTNNLIGVETQFDSIPLFGSLARNIALSQFEESRPLAVNEAENKLANRARSQFDAEIESRVESTKAKFIENIWQPSEALGLAITPVSLATTGERIVMRYRVAGEDQLGADTPRPRAPSDSVLTVQIHQSAINNVLEQLDLGGRRFSLPELANWVCQKLSRPQPKLSDDLPDDVFITFAKDNPVYIRFDEQHAELCLSIAELEQGRNRWRRFGVRTTYRPEWHDLQAGFVRDSGIRLEGKSVQGKTELVLRGIFSRALSSSRHLQLVNDKLAEDPRLRDLMVTQFSVEDGWLGLAYGPRRDDVAARRSHSTIKK